MKAFEFIVNGPPVSQQTRRRVRLHEWKRVVRAAAEQYWPPEQRPFAGLLTLRIFYFFDDAPVDIDNVTKPIHDALVGLAYADDIQVSDSVSRRRELHGQFSIADLTPVLADALDRSVEFLHVSVSKAPLAGELD
ncbi:MAG: RusA family crossover junction endodeoxyribonuclease [Gemmatimonadaceae bacterium]